MMLKVLNSNSLRKRLFVIFCATTTIFIIYSFLSQETPVCFFDQWKDGKTLKNVVENLKLRSHSNPNNVFFHETSCVKDGVLKLNSRQSCAIESTGKYT